MYVFLIRYGVEILTLMFLLHNFRSLQKGYAKGGPVQREDFLQPGFSRLLRIHVYGSSTMLVYATRRGIMDLLDPSIGEFSLSHPDIRCPEFGKIYSVNHGNYFQYEKPVQDYIQHCQRKNKDNGGPYTQRYIGSMVSDLHRNLIKGGIFMYPSTKDKLVVNLFIIRMQSFAFIVEVAEEEPPTAISES
jgi:fructose-1,6-bisphosphatase I